MDEVKLALELNKVVHNECKDVPHDIGLRLLEVVKKNVGEQLNLPPVINCVAVPEWLTDEIRALAKTTWNDHKDFNDNKRVEAMRIIQRCALAAGYTITIKKATELLQQHCL